MYIYNTGLPGSFDYGLTPSAQDDISFPLRKKYPRISAGIFYDWNYSRLSVWTQPDSVRTQLPTCS